MKRREFLGKSSGFVFGASILFGKTSTLWANTALSRIAIAYNSAASSFTGNADGSGSWTYKVTQSAINWMVDSAVMRLTGASTVGAAWETIIRAKVPSLSTTTKIGVKINTAIFGYYNHIRCPFFNRGEVVVAIANGLKQMLGGTYRIENLTVFDRRLYDGFEKYMPANGFPSNNGSTTSYDVGGTNGQYRVVLAGSNDLSTRSFLIGPFSSANTTSTQTLMNIVTSQQALINVAVPKVNLGSGVTASMKNLFGTVGDCSKTHPKGGGEGDIIHDCVPRYYAEIDKVVPIALNVLDALAGNYALEAFNGPCFMANKIAVSYDPVTLDFLAVELVNEARIRNGWAAIETPAITANRYTKQGAQYPGTINDSVNKRSYDTYGGTMYSKYVNCHSLAIAESLLIGNMNAGERIVVDYSGISAQDELASLGTPQGRPLGVVRTAGQWRLEVQFDRSGRTHRVESRILDLFGKEVRSFKGSTTTGSRMSIDWDGRNASGVGTARGVYCWEIRIDGVAYSQTIHQT